MQYDGTEEKNEKREYALNCWVATDQSVGFL